MITSIIIIIMTGVIIILSIRLNRYKKNFKSYTNIIKIHQEDKKVLLQALKEKDEKRINSN